MFGGPSGCVHQSRLPNTGLSGEDYDPSDTGHSVFHTIVYDGEFDFSLKDRRSIHGQLLAPWRAPGKRAFRA
jgi:hypothetical protein